ncbi:MAG: hypothetical protein ACLFQV_10970 [Vulcanimicrobiota bacterium]
MKFIILCMVLLVFTGCQGEKVLKPAGRLESPSPRRSVPARIN